MINDATIARICGTIVIAIGVFGLSLGVEYSGWVVFAGILALLN